MMWGSRPGVFTPEERAPPPYAYPFDRRMGGPKNRSCKSLFPGVELNPDPSVLLPVAQPQSRLYKTHYEQHRVGRVE
jgi:hypothetical protein